MVLELKVPHRLAGPGEALGRNLKGEISSVLYVVAIALAFVSPWISLAIYALVAVMWLIPDRRIEHAIAVES
jgi:uncharacterized membrane protein